MSRPLRGNDTELRQMAAQRIDCLGALAHQKIARPEQHAPSLLFPPSSQPQSAWSAATMPRRLAASRIAILDALLKLRQACCDPRLVRLDAARKVSESAKRARLLALLDELVAEGRRVLIFSQFVKMLKLVERDIAARGWGYAMLHGATKDRDAQVAAFQSGDLPVFLVSLKAGGTGLNLTAADTVIVYDPWWNPAVERQAMDRAHRIGQDKPVFVHRLIAENTVEAAIQRMQARKQALADALFEGTGQGPLALTEEDIHALFGPG